MWWNVGPRLKKRMQNEAGKNPDFARTNSSFFKSDTDLGEFKQILRTKFGSLTRAWRVGLDSDSTGLLDFHEFCSAAKAIGYVGNLRTLWFNMDTDGSGAISLKEIDEAASYVLEKFRALSTKKYGSMEAMWTQLLDRDRSGAVSFAEFREHVPGLGYGDQEEIWELFNLLLVKPGCTSITLHDIVFLQTWEETKQAQAFRKRLPTTWVNKDPFLHGKPEIPGTPRSDDYSATTAYDPGQLQEDFRRFLIERYGTLTNAFDTMDANGSGSLSMVEFQSVVSTVLRYCRPSEANRLFMTFNDDPGAMLTWDELGITAPEWINHVLAKRTKQRQREAAAYHGAAAGGAGARLHGGTPRAAASTGAHVARLRCPERSEDVAFWAPLPKGWGRPPHFEPRVAAAKGWLVQCGGRGEA